MSESLSGKRIVIIGGSGVLGAEFARQLHAAGAEVSLLVRNPSSIPADLSDLVHAQVDIGDREALTAALTTLRAGGIDGMINAAGVVAFGALNDVPESIVEELFRTNALGTMNVLACGSGVVSEGGFIASLTGVAADMVVMNMSAYCASKSAAHSAMAVAARELRSKKITVLDVRAPHTETGLTDRALWGTAPKMPAGLAPSALVARVITALVEGERDLPADAFSE
jgi:cyclic-di-GMP-binding biofilm dispersal mediator protein